MGDYRLSPAYDLLNSRIHIEDKDLALEDRLLASNLAKGSVIQQFNILAQLAELNEKQINDIFKALTSGNDKVANLLDASFLSEKIKLNYWQAYQTGLKKLT